MGLDDFVVLLLLISFLCGTIFGTALSMLMMGLDVCTEDDGGLCGGEVSMCDCVFGTLRIANIGMSIIFGGLGR